MSAAFTRRAFAGGLAALGATSGALLAQTEAPATITVGVVSRTSLDWPIYVADKLGFFRDAGLNVSVITASGGTSTINLLASGDIQIASDSVNDFMAASSHGISIAMIAPSFQPNPYTIMTLPSIRSWADLKGKTVAIGPKLNAPGVTFNHIINAHRLTFDDLSLIIIPSTNLRYAALLSGHVAATILSQPFDIIAAQHGMRRIAEARDYFKVWQFEVLATNRDWLRANRPLAVRFLRAVRDATKYAYAHRSETVTALTSSIKIDADVAARTYDLDFKKWHAFDPDLRYNEAGVRAVAQAAVDSGGIRNLPPLTDVYDPSVAAEAIR